MNENGDENKMTKAMPHVKQEPTLTKMTKKLEVRYVSIEYSQFMKYPF